MMNFSLGVVAAALLIQRAQNHQLAFHPLAEIMFYLHRIFLDFSAHLLGLKVLGPRFEKLG